MSILYRDFHSNPPLNLAHLFVAKAREIEPCKLQCDGTGTETYIQPHPPPNEGP